MVLAVIPVSSSMARFHMTTLPSRSMAKVGSGMKPMTSRRPKGGA